MTAARELEFAVIQRLLNLSLRSFTLGTRFVFIFFLARYLEPEAVGYYGLFTATVSYFIFVIGLDFYAYVTREILHAPVERRGSLLKAQIVLSGSIYFALVPLAFGIISQAGWPSGLIWWFFPILLLEYTNQELSRLLIVLSRQLTASLVLLLRQGSWAVAIVVLMTFEPTTRSLEWVMALWVVAGIAAATVGGVVIHRTRMGGWRLPVDWKWVKKGIRVGLAFLLATLALRGLQTLDRYWLEALGGIELVAAYVLFIGIAGTLLAILDASVFAYTYPALISHNHAQERGSARKKMRAMFFQTAVVCLGFSIISWIILPFLLEWVKNPVYQQALPLYPWILAAMVLNALGMVPHYGLYAFGCDRPIIYSHVAALPTFIISVWFVSGFNAVLAVPVGLTLSFALILIWKTIAYLRADQARHPAT